MMIVAPVVYVQLADHSRADELVLVGSAPAAWIIGSEMTQFDRMFGLPVTRRLTTGLEPYLLGLIAAVGLFVSVVIHESGRSVVHGALE